MSASDREGFVLPVLGAEEPAGCSCCNTQHGYGKRYWRSLEEKSGSLGFQLALEHEFPQGATEPPQGFARREFLTLAGASLALAGVTACTDRPRETIMPYTRTPADVAPGTPLHFATATAINGYASGLLVTSWEGRPTKIEGNPDHPTNAGTTGIIEQALALQLYDPDRARDIKEHGQARAWRVFLKQLAARVQTLSAKQGEGLYLLLEPSASPFRAELVARVKRKFPKTTVLAYGATTDDAVLEGTALATGQPLQVDYDLSRADVVVSLDADFLQPLPRHLPLVRAFTERRDPVKGNLNRLYAFEANLSITGAFADHRLRTRSSEIAAVAQALWVRVQSGVVTGPQLDAEQTRFVDALSEDLLQRKGRAVVIAGERQPAVVHAMALAINEALGAVGPIVKLSQPVLNEPRAGVAALQSLVADISAGKVDTLLIDAWNPVYSAPSDLALADALKRVPVSIYRGLHEDETARVASWFIPATHALESWGDARAADGTISIVQPLISPLFNGYSETELLNALLEEGDRGSHAPLKEFWRGRTASPDFGRSWETWLARGIVAREPPVAVKPTLTPARIVSAIKPAPSRDGLEINFVASPKLLDGRFANVSWLQELPDTMTKMTWDNAALMSAATARVLNAKTGDVLELRYGAKSLRAPAYVLPGHVDGSITLELGYGRDSSGERVAHNVGVNANALRLARAPFFDTGLVAHLTRDTHPFALTQHHWSMKATPESEARPLALEQTVEDFRRHPDFTEDQRGPQPTLQEPVKYPGLAWAMGVDLARCIGCNACVVACQAENNIPVVGKEQVARGREMHWLRIDRWFEGDEADPGVITQPVACVHCEAAPCEYVCPVNATVHSDEGLNEMVYNRCVGTRYCSNNCPYKVRRFNFLHWNANKSDVEKMGMNPDVTVRARGVMEKCTYCVQRIERARISARVEGRELTGAEVTTACQQACPAKVISFGSLSEPESAVGKHHRDPRRYDLLHELNTRPRTAYLTRLKNPNPKLG